MLLINTLNCICVIQALIAVPNLMILEQFFLFSMLLLKFFLFILILRSIILTFHIITIFCVIVIPLVVFSGDSKITHRRSIFQISFAGSSIIIKCQIFQRLRLTIATSSQSLGGLQGHVLYTYSLHSFNQLRAFLGCLFHIQHLVVNIITLLLNYHHY